MAKKPDKKGLEQLANQLNVGVDDLKKMLDDKKDGESDLSRYITHRKKGGGFKSMLAEKEAMSAKATGKGDTVRTVASWIFNDRTSKFLGDVFDKRYTNPKGGEDSTKGGRGAGRNGVSKKDLEQIQQYMSKTLSKTQTVSKKFKETNEEIDDAKTEITDEIEGLHEYMSKTLSKTQTVSKKFKETNEEIDELKELIENMGDEETNAEVEIQGKIGLIEKRVNAAGRVYYHDTGAKQHVSKAEYIAQEEGRRIPTNGSVTITKTIQGFKKSIESITKENKSISKIAEKILQSITAKETAGKTASGAKPAKPANEVITSMLNPNPEDADFLSPAFTQLEADEQQRITEDALHDALKKVLKEDPNLLQGNKSFFEGLLNKGLGGIASRLLGKGVGGVKAVAQGAAKAGGGLVKAAKNVVGKGASAAARGLESVAPKAASVLGRGAEAAKSAVGGIKSVAGAAKGVASTAVKKGGGDVAKKVTGLLAKNSGKIIGKSIAGVGLLFSAWDMAKHAAKGDWTGVGLDAVAAAGSTAELTGVGAAAGAPAAILASLTNVVRDGYEDIFGIPPEKDPNFKANMNQALEIGSDWVKQKLGMETKKEEKKPAAAADLKKTEQMTKPAEGAAAVATAATKPAAATKVTTTATLKPVTASAQAPAVPPPTPAAAAAPMPSADELTAKIMEQMKADREQELADRKQYGSTTSYDKLTGTVNTRSNRPVNVTNNTMLPPPAAEGSKMEINNSHNTLNRLMAHDTDNPWAAINR